MSRCQRIRRRIKGLLCCYESRSGWILWFLTCPHIYHARVDCFRKKIVIQHLVNFELVAVCGRYPPRISVIHAIVWTCWEEGSDEFPARSRLLMPLHFWLHRVHGLHYGVQVIPLEINSEKQKHSFYVKDSKSSGQVPPQETLPIELISTHVWQLYLIRIISTLRKNG